MGVIYPRYISVEKTIANRKIEIRDGRNINEFCAGAGGDDCYCVNDILCILYYIYIHNIYNMEIKDSTYQCKGVTSHSNDIN